MIGSGKNIGRTNLVIGQPLAEDVAGNVMPADTNSTAFAICIRGSPAGGTVAFSDSGIVSRADWSIVAGTSKLVPGSAYYVSAGGKLALSGHQQVGVARNGTDLRVSISQVQSAYSQMHLVQGAPATALGVNGDTAFDSSLGRLYAKIAGRWTGPFYAMMPASPPNQVPFRATATVTGWQPCS